MSGSEDAVELALRVDAILRDVRSVRHSWESAVALYAAYGRGAIRNVVLPQKVCDTEGLSRCRSCGTEWSVPIGALPPVVCQECGSFELAWVIRPHFSVVFPRGGPARKYSGLDFYADMGSFFDFSARLRALKTRSQVEHGRDVARWLYCEEVSTYGVADAYRDTWGKPVSAEAIRRLTQFWADVFTHGAGGRPRVACHESLKAFSARQEEHLT